MRALVPSTRLTEALVFASTIGLPVIVSTQYSSNALKMIDSGETTPSSSNFPPMKRPSCFRSGSRILSASEDLPVPAYLWMPKRDFSDFGEAKNNKRVRI